MDPTRLVRLEKEFVSNGSSSQIPEHFASNDEYAWNAEAFQKHARVDIKALSPSTVDFDIVHIDASVANALRRVLISEVPTVAIEDVMIWNNTTLVHDEVLAQRLGLVPLNVDPRKLEDRPTGEASTGRNSVVFNFKVGDEFPADPRKTRRMTDAELVDSKYVKEVLSDTIEYVPQGDQLEVLFEGSIPEPVNKEILLLKYRGDQQVVAQLIARKGIGKEHAKWSPVSTASYRLHPHIDILEPIPAKDLEKFQKCFSPGVIDISSGKAVVQNPRLDSVSREVLRHPEFEGKVKLGRIRDHFLYTVESVGQYKPEELLPEACDVLLQKISVMKTALSQLPQVNHS